MSGFWTKTPDGHVIHIAGDPNMSAETRLILSVMMVQAAKAFSACVHPATESTPIYSTHWGPHFTFTVHRCQQCAEVTVKVLGNQNGSLVYLATLPTRIAPYCTGAPQHGYAYYWRFGSLNHSTPPIAPAPAAC